MIRRLIIFGVLLAICCIVIAALAYPHFRLALFVAFIVWLLWVVAGRIKENSEEYETEEGP
jgi:hypothetical protein